MAPRVCLCACGLCYVLCRLVAARGCASGAGMGTAGMGSWRCVRRGLCVRSASGAAGLGVLTVDGGRWQPRCASYLLSLSYYIHYAHCLYVAVPCGAVCTCCGYTVHQEPEQRPSRCRYRYGERSLLSAFLSIISMPCFLFLFLTALPLFFPLRLYLWARERKRKAAYFPGLLPVCTRCLGEIFMSVGGGIAFIV